VLYYTAFNISLTIKQEQSS